MYVYTSAPASPEECVLESSFRHVTEHGYRPHFRTPGPPLLEVVEESTVTVEIDRLTEAFQFEDLRPPLPTLDLGRSCAGKSDVLRH